MDTFIAKEHTPTNVFVIKSFKSCKQSKAPIVFRMWQFTINFLFYFGLTPFKCEYSTENGQWHLKGSLFHKVSCDTNFVNDKIP